MNILSAFLYFLFASGKKNEEQQKKSSIVLGEPRVKIRCPNCKGEMYIERLKVEEEGRGEQCPLCKVNFYARKNTRTEG
jgi:Zn finger protein HypA/HybF involved in hydrogenase expression